jgi:hypothetical protein
VSVFFTTCVTQKGAFAMFKPNRFAVLLAGVTLAFAAWAQPAEQADPPTRVARLSYIHGDVSFVPAGENDWVQAQLNRPLVTGDKLFTDNGSRAALEIGAASIRMDQNTNFDFLNLDDNTAQMELTQGSLNLRVRRLYDGQSYEVDTPTLAFVVNRVGEFRIDVLPNGQATIVNVLNGGGDVYGEGGARFRVEEGQSVTFNDPQLQDYAVADLSQPDAFDDFCHQRDRRANASTSRRYVSEEVIGYEDLDDYGEWTSVETYGSVWYPTSIAVGWSPYHYGHWGWVGAYGWTWVDDAPWGFAPFHYGRWVSVGGRWGWCPGRIDVRPVYAPALVAFVGGSVGIGISVGEPIGWFPLGWGEPYIPSYHVSQTYFTNVNVSNTVINNTVINNYYGNYSAGNVNYNQITYANRNIAGAVTAVPAQAFVSARPVATSAIAVRPETFANAHVNGFAAVAPTRASLAPAVAAKAIPTAAVASRPIVAATKPPAPVASFATRQAVLAKNPGQPLPQQQLHTTAAATTGGAAAVAARPNLKVVTTGAPVHTEAPKLPPKTATSATTARTTGPVTTQSAVQTQATGQAVTGKGQQTPHVDSSRFAHPATGATGNAAVQTQHTPSNAVQSTSPVTTGRTPTVQSQTTGQGSKVQTQQYHAPQTQTQSQVQSEQYHKPATQTSHAPTQSQVPAVQSQQHTPTQTYQAEQYKKPQGQTQQQQYHAPAQTTQQYHAPVQTQQQGAAVQTQQQHTPQVQQQPRYTPPPQQQQQQHQDKNKKDDDKKHGGG